MPYKQLLTFIIISLTLMGCSFNKETNKITNEQIIETTQSPSQTAINKEKLSQTTYRFDPQTSLIVPKDNSVSEKVVLLTFDDTPDGHAMEIAKALKERNVSAMFLVNGHFLETEEQKQIIKDIYNMGFMIGNHTYHHPYLNQLNKEQQREEIVPLNDIVEDITGERPTFFRPPFGVYDEITNEIVHQEGMHLMMWSFGYDWQADYQSPEKLTEITLNTPYLGNGSNILMHDRSWTAEAIGAIVDGLKEKGFQIVDPYSIEPYQNGGSQ
ncbi:polysaccharide deacetylase family protein [Atopobacter phocae]|uniref:polysaccharide deacetylase family protein n=1 Tax=Atopobacter phocae TaxID=136492 RepID=UPI00046ED43F|nr:polysaccharide deacetylase family protein [Atopobacter phocae]